MTRVAGVLARGRRAAEALMVDTCRITRPGTGERDYDKGTMQYTDPQREVVYEGKCRVQLTAQSVGASNQAAGERLTTIQVAELQLPVVGTEGVAVHDVAEILTAKNDDALQGRQLTIAARHEKTHATSRRLRLKEATS